MPKKPDRTREEAILAATEARLLELLADVQEKRRRLTAGEATRTVNSVQPVLSDAHRVALSESRPSKDAKFLAHIRASGYSLNRLAKAVHMSPSALSQARRRPTDEHFRRIPPDKAAQIEALTGWPVANWP